jgi:hypothetical protein
VKKSDRLLAFGGFYCCAVVVALIITVKVVYGYKPYGPGPGEPPLVGSYAGADPNRAGAPGSGIPWHQVDFGLRRTGINWADQSRSIFRDIPLHYWSHYHYAFYSFFNKNRRGFSRYQDFYFCLTPSDSNRWDDMDKYVHVETIQHRSGHPSADSSRYGFFLRDVKESVRLSDDGIQRYWTRSSAACEWYSGGWHTVVGVPLKAFGGDRAKTVELREKICERILAYYATLK